MLKEGLVVRGNSIAEMPCGVPLQHLSRCSEIRAIRELVRRRRVVAASALIFACLQPSSAPSQLRALAPVSKSIEEPITPIPVPPALDPLKVRLGERLFDDVRLSHDNSRSCSSCHDVGTNGAIAKPHDVDADGAELPVNTLTISVRCSTFGWAVKESSEV
ncbi:cytochrome c peroxidase [Bradyrhizobium sp. Pa8]|uniref:cytochrome c peroxidase n=1 Tax=Bradyrhizobium sp. Pa8 TaxID=3386552 RepID=UPI00403F4A37